MSELKFEGTVIVKSTKKGTKTKLEPMTPMGWTGKGFKRVQERRSKIRGLKIGSSKGTSKIDLTKIRKTSVPKIEVRYISTKKGTELLKL